MKLNSFNIEKTMLDYQSHKFDEMKEIANETIKENKTLNNTIDIQKIKIDMLEKEKQQLISFLENKIKETDKTRKMHKMYSLSEERLSSKYYAFCEVLDFVNKGSKE